RRRAVNGSPTGLPTNAGEGPGEIYTFFHRLDLAGTCTRPFAQAATNSFLSMVPSLLVSICAMSSACAKFSGATSACAGASPVVIQTVLHCSGVRTPDG